MIRKLLSKKEICDILGMSKVTLYFRLKEFGVKPIENSPFKIKQLFKVSDIKRHFPNFVLPEEEDLVERAEEEEEAAKEKPSEIKKTKPTKELNRGIKDILKEDE